MLSLSNVKEGRNMIETRNEVLRKLKTKAVELELDTTIADSVMGIGKAIDILIGLLFMAMGEDDATKFVQGVMDEAKEGK
tara:strand:+ start:215 stop:454 length:240 start_codon:yes stop_codon:yes gene_type:complete